MTKMRVHELAKELGMDNKELLDILKNKNVDVKNHMSTLEDEVTEQIRREASAKKNGGAAAPAEKKEEAKAERPAEKAEAKEGAAPKKKNLAFVIRPQNSKNSSRLQGRPGQRAARPAQGGRPAPGTRPSADGRPARPAGESHPPRQESPAQTGRPAAEARPAGEARPAAEIRPAGERASAEGRTQGDNRTVRQERPAQAGRPTAEGRTAGESRPSGERRPAGEGRPSGDNRQPRQDRGFQGNRPSGDRRTSGEGRFSGEGRGPRQERGAQGGRPSGEGRSFGDNRGRQERGGRDQRFGSRDQRNSGAPGQRGERRTDSRRDDVSSSMVEQQKSQRNKAKDKERDNRKKEYRDEAFEGKAAKKGKKQKQVAEVKRPQPKEEKKEEQIKQIVIPEVITIKELADKMKIVPSVIIKKLFMQGKVVTVNQEVDFDTAEEIAMEFDVLCEKEEVVDVIEELLKEDEEDESLMVKRPPVVCVMGHVDHGKTSLLDAIRHTNVIDREAGGITQHIGAYVVEVNGEKITFLDTPGHEAFTAMRMRGANATDIAILVVAADDGVMPQTVEAINHAKAAGVEIIVAINKIDKPSANVERVKQELTEYELIPEDWGGSTVFVPVSAHTKEGIPELLEMILLTAEVMELKANPNRAARGLVIEAQLDKGKGPVATVLVQKGTLHIGDAIAAGSAHGRVRAMMDDRGRRVKEAGPSQPVEILGLNDVPNAGEVFVGCDSEKEARNFADTFIAQNKVKLLDETKSKMSLDDLFNQIQEGNLKELNIVVKADVQGSVEALKQSLLKLSNDEVVIKVIHGGVGAINESDVILASASNAIIIGFNVRPDATAKEIAEREGVDLRLYRVIYNAIEDVEAAMKGMLDPVFEEKILGHAEVRQTFKASGVGTIAGAYVKDGVFERNCSTRLIRDGIVIFDGPLASLKRFKDDVKEVRAGYECGFVFENYNDIKEGDQVEAYKMVETERK
ncbi:translation initiation factor IF-2 [Lachnoclostridium sp. An169]|uniref:translation initiation factor IF-2 n=1 Tax=Lachnoclostridium sp. An169 TaxID=1965569 RepID=UPI000B392990|nr:translation initiation factor IF-2 [Lachnoclostridium sp. An169]OUP84820.1 translation initiation factor IF-2 [Lachnoclostridium sp. An169]